MLPFLADQAPSPLIPPEASAFSPTTYSGEVRAHNDLTNPHVATHWGLFVQQEAEPW